MSLEDPLPDTGRQVASLQVVHCQRSATALTPDPSTLSHIEDHKQNPSSACSICYETARPEGLTGKWPSESTVEPKGSALVA